MKILKSTLISGLSALALAACDTLLCFQLWMQDGFRRGDFQLYKVRGEQRRTI